MVTEDRLLPEAPMDADLEGIVLREDDNGDTEAGGSHPFAPISPGSPQPSPVAK